MIRFFYRIAFFSLVLSFSWSLSAAAQPTVSAPSPVVAKVGSLAITQADVDIRAQKLLPMQVSFHGKVDAEKIAGIKREALEGLLDRAYKVQFAINEELSIDGTAFEKEWQERLSKNQQVVSKASAAQLNKVKSELYLDQLARKAEKVAVDDKITVTDQQVAAYYKEHTARYFRPKLYTASHIFVKVEPTANAEERDAKLVRIEELLKRAKAGEDFYNLAYYESDDRSKYVGGSLGSFHAGQTVPEFDAAIQAMKPGEIVGPIRTMYGLHIIKLDSVDEERQLAFDEVSSKIRTNLVDAEREQLYERWMAKLKEQYPLERFNQ